jgi:signal transduction histidine kinase
MSIPARQVIIHTVAQEWLDLALWVSLAVILNLFPVVLGAIRITLDMPVLLAVAILFPPPVAALAGWLAGFDKRELSGGIRITDALFNRSQISLSVFLASIVFHRVVPDLDQLTLAAIGTAAALLTDVAANISLIMVYLIVRSGGKLKVATRAVPFQHPVVFAVHLGYGGLALVLAYLVSDVGKWSVVAFLIPFLAAQQLLARNQKLVELTGNLRSHERLVARALDRTIDERRDERRSIAAELHDDVLQSLVKISILGHLLKKDLPSDSLVKDDVEQLLSLYNASIESLRCVMLELRQSPLGFGGLMHRLQALSQDLKLESGIRIEVRGPTELEVSPDVQVVIYQVAREALTNAIKHSRAASVNVLIDTGRAETRLCVQDDGVGFEKPSVDSSTHFGLGIMEERVHRAGGTFDIESRPNLGTRVQAVFPSRLR